MSTGLTTKQVPDHSILDHFNKSAYLGTQFSYILDNYEPAATTETPIILLQNPAVTSSGYPSGYTSLFIRKIKALCVTATQSALLKVYLNPTLNSAGTSQTANNMRTGSSIASIATLTKLPNIAANGTLINVLSSNAFSTDSSDDLIILDPGSKLLITTIASSNTTFLSAFIDWYEL